MTNCARFLYYKKDSETFYQSFVQIVLTNTAIFKFFTVSRLFDEPYKILARMKNLTLMPNRIMRSF